MKSFAVAAAQLQLALLLLFAASCAVANSFHGSTTDMAELYASSVVSASPSLPCQEASEAVGVPDWDTICILSSDVSTCDTKNMSYQTGSYCRLHYLCTGWVGDSSQDYNPTITLAFVSRVTNVSRLTISEKGHRGWIAKIELLATDNYIETVYEVPAGSWDTPSETYKLSPKQRDGGAFYAPGLDYRGGVNVSTSGNPCVFWSAQTYLDQRVDNGLAGATNNYCRNPDNDENGPWCFTAGLAKEYCTVPTTESCDDQLLLLDIDPPLDHVFYAVRITMKHSQGAFPAIDAISTTAAVAGSCDSDITRGYWAEPHCRTCATPFKGTNCNELSCAVSSGSGTYACVYGTCNSATDTCDCYPGFFGASCNSVCPTNQDITAVTQSNGYINPDLVDVLKLCSGHGVCDEGASGSGSCICAAYYATADCHVACPRDSITNLVCSNNGTCNDGASGDGKCACRSPRYGADCSKRLCGAKQCWNGDCIDDARCACKYDSLNGYWTGTNCDKCAAGYSGSGCKTKVSSKVVFTGDVKDVITYFTTHWSSMYLHILPRVNSVVTVTFENAGTMTLGAVSGSMCQLRPDRARPKQSCQVDIAGGVNSPNPPSQILWLQLDPAMLSMDSNARADESTYTITVEFESGCGLSTDCGHGYCVATYAALAPWGLGAYAVDHHATVESQHAEVAAHSPGVSLSRRMNAQQGASRTTAEFEVSVVKAPTSTVPTASAKNALHPPSVIGNEWDDKALKRRERLQTAARAAEAAAREHTGIRAMNAQVTVDEVEAATARSAHGDSETTAPLGARRHEQSSAHQVNKLGHELSNEEHTLIDEQLASREHDAAADGPKIAHQQQHQRQGHRPRGATDEVIATHNAAKKLKREAAAEWMRVRGADRSGSTHRKLLSPPPIVTQGTPLLTQPYYNYIDWNYAYDTSGGVTFVLLTNGATPLVGGNPAAPSDLYYWNTDNALESKYDSLTNPSGGTGSMYFGGVNPCTSYDIWMETYDPGATAFSGPLLFAANLQPAAYTYTVASSLQPQTNSVQLWIKTFDWSIVHLCVKPSGGSATEANIRTCTGGVHQQVPIYYDAVLGSVGSVRVTGRAPNTAYEAFWLVADQCDNAAPGSTIQHVTVTTLAAGIPDVVASSITNVQARTATLQVTVTANGNVAWAVQVIDGVSTPMLTASEVLSATFGTNGVYRAGTTSVTTGPPNAISVSGLWPQKTYRVYYITQNGAATQNSNVYEVAASFTTAAATYPVVEPMNAVIAGNVITCNIRIDSAGDFVFAFVPQGTNVAAYVPGELWQFNQMPGLRTTSRSTSNSAGTSTGFTITLPDTCNNFELYGETKNVGLGPLTNYGVFSANTAPPTISVAQQVSGSNTLRILFQTNVEARLRVCVTPSGSGVVDPDICPGGTQQVMQGLTTFAVGFTDLDASTSYDVSYAAGTNCPAPMWSTAAKTTLATNAAGAPELLNLEFVPGANDVSLRFDASSAGTLVFVVQDNTGTETITKAGIDALTGATSVWLLETHAIVQGANYITSANLLSVGTTFMVNMYSEDAGATTYSGYFTDYFSTGGTLPYADVYLYDSTQIHGTSVRLTIEYEAMSIVRYMVKLSTDTEPTLQEMVDMSSSGMLAGATIVTKMKRFATVFDLERVYLDVSGLQPLTPYYVYSLVADVTDTFRDPHPYRRYFATNDEGISRCNAMANNQPCTRSAGPDATGMCACFPGYTCSSIGMCLDEETLYAGFAGYCKCKQSASEGYWNGTTCSACLHPYFGNGCRSHCVHGVRNATGNGCVCSTHFTGEMCDQCLSVNGYYGENCDQVADIVTNKNTVTTSLHDIYEFDPIRVLTYSEVFLNISMLDGVKLDAISLVEIVFLKRWVPADFVGDAYLNSNGDLLFLSDQADAAVGKTEPTSSTVACGTTAEPVLYTVSTTNNLVISCHSSVQWDSTTTTQWCSADVPAGYNYAIIRIVGARAATYDLTYRAAGECCNGHGFCADSENVCTCVLHPDLGFYNFLDNCTTCARGYTGARCADFAGATRNFISGTLSLSIGSEAWFGFRVQENMKFNAKMASSADCDLSVRLTSRCGEGWSFWNNRCYKIFADIGECTTPALAPAQCKKQGGSVATVRSTDDLNFFRTLFTASGLGKTSSANSFCSTRVIVDARRANPRCMDGGWDGRNNQAKCLAEPTGACFWDTGVFPPRCNFDQRWNCFSFSPSRTNCEEPTPGTRRYCQWVEYASGRPDGSGIPTTESSWSCQPTYAFRDTTLTRFETIDLLSDFSQSDIGTLACEDFDGDMYSCKLLEYCTFVNAGARCVLNSDALHKMYGYGFSPMLQWSADESFYGSNPRCLYMTARTYEFGAGARANVFFGEMQCDVKATNNPVREGSMAYGEAAFMCERDPSFVESVVDPVTRVMQPTTEQQALMGVPSCTVDDIASSATCAAAGNSATEFAVVRVVCQAAASLNVNVSLVPDGRIDGFSGFDCYNNLAVGSWAGQICTECSPRYKGRECNQFEVCTADSDCGGHGTCDLGTGYCVCDADYFGVDCSAHCTSAGTCNGGVCNVNYQVCPGTFGTSRSCDVEVPICSACTGHRGGSNCDTCATGYWNVASDCAQACACNGQPCDVNTGVCGCYADEFLGYWDDLTNCTSCSPGFYGRTCTTACNETMTCNDHGTCSKTGLCACDANYYGTNCQTFCSASHCNNKGTCHATTGVCECYSTFAAGFYTGATCAVCQSGYWGVRCDFECQCNAQGACNALTGACECYDSDEKGHFDGTACEKCSEGWSGSDCKTSTMTASNRIGIMAKVQVKTSARLVKARIGGTLLMFNSTTTGKEHLWATSGKQVSEYTRPRGSMDGSAWAHTSSCELGAGTTDDNVLAAEISLSRGYALYLVNKTNGLMLSALNIDGSAFTSGTACSGVHVALYPKALYASNNTGGTAEGVMVLGKGMVFDAATDSVYVLYKAVNASLNIDQVYVSRMSIWEASDIRKGFTHPRKSQFKRFDDLTDAHTITLARENGVSYIVLAGLDRQSNVMFVKAFLPDGQRESIRPVYSWRPPICKSYVCWEVSRAAYLEDSKYYVAIRTTVAAVSRIVVIQMDIEGAQLKNATSNYNTVLVPATAVTNCSFIAYDAYVNVFYVGVHDNGANPGKIYKFDAAFERTYSTSLALSYEQTKDEKQIAVAARVLSWHRQMLVVNHLTRSSVMTTVLYEVERIEPNVVDGNGGTIVNVTGNGFADLGTDIYCKFGTRVNRQLIATFIDSTRIVCRAPMVTSFDPCVAVPLELAVMGTTSFTNNQILVTQVNIPQVSNVLPTSRGGLTLDEPLTIVGSGFINTAYLTCFANGLRYPATFVSSTSVLCQPDSQDQPRNTTLQVSLDGQSFTNNQVYYYFVGPPSFFAPVMGSPRSFGGKTHGKLTDTGFIADSDVVVPLPKIATTFYDAAYTDLQSRDTALRGHNLTISLSTRPTAPLGDSQYGLLRGTLSVPIILGAAVFPDLYLDYPGAGTYVLNIGSTYSGVSNRTVSFVIQPTATRLTFSAIPPDFSTNKEALSTETIVRFSDVSDNTGVNEIAKVIAAVVAINGTTGATSSATLTGTDVKTDAGLAKFPDLRIENGVEGAFYKLVFTATTSTGLLLSLESAPIRVAQCDVTVNWISRVVPNAGTLGSQVITVKGWGYTKALEARTKCKFGADTPVQATFVDKCTVVCTLPAQTNPVSAALEVTTTTDTEFSAYGFTYSYISTVQSVSYDTDASTTYPAAAVVSMDNITLRFRDAFGTWVNAFDTANRTLFMSTTAPLLNSTGMVPKSLTARGDAKVTFANLRIGYPLIGRYAFFFSTDATAAIPTFSGAASNSSTSATLAPTATTSAPIVIVVNQTNGTTACPKPITCHSVGHRFVECLYTLDEQDISYTQSVSQEIELPSSLDPNATLVPTPAPTTTTAAPTTLAPTLAPVPTVAPNVHFAALYLFDVTEGVPAQLLLVGTYDLYTTGKRKLDRQPTIRVADVAGNTVQTYSAKPTVTASIDPQPPCIVAAPEGTSNLAQYERDCERLAGRTMEVTNGIAAFTLLRFVGVRGQQYRLTFSVNLANVPALKGAPMYSAECPAGNALLDHVEPNWLTTSKGAVITAKGWDFQPDAALILKLGSTSVTCTFVDTCTAYCPVAATGTDAPATAARRQASTSAITPGALTVSLASGTTSSTPIAGSFQIKSSAITHTGYSKTARGLYLKGALTNHSQKLTVKENVTCTLLEAETADDARDCYTSNTVVNINPIFVATQDSGEGDIFEGYGWDATVNSDTDIAVWLKSKPVKDKRELAEIINGTLVGRTWRGLLTLSNLRLNAPRSGDYVLQLGLKSGALITRSFTIRVTPGTAHTLTISHSLPQDGVNTYNVKNNAALGLKASIKDIADNNIGISALSGFYRLAMTATIVPLYVLQPPPFADLNVSVNSSLADSSFSGSPTDLGNEDFDFSTATVNNLKFGVKYSLTFRIEDAALNALLPSQRMFVTLAPCQNGQYSKNFTADCATIPEGGETRVGNHTLWLYAQSGYWRPIFTDDRFYACPGDNCIGGYYSDCASGTKGPVCAVCQTGYGKQGTNCLKCPSDGVNAVVLIAIMLAVLVVIFVMVQSNLSAEVRPKSVFSIVIKILLNHLQTATLMQDFQAKIKGIVKDLMDIQSQATPDTNFTSFSCLTGWNMYAIFLMWMLVPLFILGVPGVIAAVAGASQRRSLRKKQERLEQELTRRRKLGLATEDLELHLDALATKTLPERIFTVKEVFEDDEVRSSAEVSAPGSEMQDRGMDEMMVDEMRRHEQEVERQERRNAEIDRRARALFGGSGGAPDDDDDGAATSGEEMPAKGVDALDGQSPSDEFDSLALANQGSAAGAGGGMPVNSGGLENCSICCADFALYRCDECDGEPLFCETCWSVVHSSEGDRADHDRLMYRVVNTDEREYNRRYMKLYKEVMQTKNKVPALEIWIVTVLVVIFLIYPSLMTQIAMMMKCVHIESINRSFLAADYTIECGTTEYGRWVLIARVFFFAYGMGIPLAGTVLLFTKRKTLLEKGTLATYGFLYSGYRLQYFFWEFVIMIRKMLVVFIIVFYEGDSKYSIMFGMWLVLCFLILNIAVQPFQLRLYWVLENISLASVTFTLNAAMLYQPQYDLDPTSDNLVTLMIFIVNVLVLALFAYFIIFAIKMQMLQSFDLDGSGDVSWAEFVLSIKNYLFTEHGKALKSWGFQVEDVSEQIEELRRQRKAKKLMAAETNWKRTVNRRRSEHDFDQEEELDEAAEDGAEAPADVDADQVGIASDRGATPQPASQDGGDTPRPPSDNVDIESAEKI
jgi:hypothetical protein